MAQHQTTVTLPLQPDEVFAHLRDLTNAATWDPSIVEVTRAAAEDRAEGATYRVVVGLFGRRLELRYRVERVEPPSAVVLVATGRSLERRDSYTIEPDPGGSRVTLCSEIRLRGALRLLDRGLQLQLATMVDRAAAGLASQLAPTP